MSERVLLIEDDVELTEALAPQIECLGVGVDCAHDGQSGLEMALSGTYSLVVLDIMLPKLDGVEVCKRIRQKDPAIPILMLSSKSEELNKVLLLELGADDYITKPFGVSELTARIKAALRRGALSRSGQSNPAESLICGELAINFAAYSATLAGQPLELTAAEFQILALLASELGNVFSRDEIVEAMHGTPMHGYETAVTTHINRIRSKIEPDPARPKYLLTVRGAGYRLVDPTAK